MGRQSQYKQKRDAVIAAIETLTAKLGKSPSLREISNETGVSIATLHSYMGKLQAEGAIEWQEKSHRSIRLKASGAPVPLPSSPSPNSNTSQSGSPSQPGAVAAPKTTVSPVPPPAPTVVPAPVAAPALTKDLEDIDPGF